MQFLLGFFLSFATISSSFSNSVDSWNLERKIFAEQANIANMNELVWDVKLAEKAAKMKCDELRHGGDYRVFRAGDQNGRSPEQLAKELDRNGKDVLGSDFEPFNPIQTRIGCGRKTDCEICLIGPINILYKSDFKRGATGSSCEHGRAGTVGLCHGSPVSTTGPPIEAPGLISAETIVKCLFLFVGFYFA
ncbi:unnamed protein product [Caenorhabditis sp. 36 PRJEB53466]|nr:unnamed protein product [Caenorhabditis sp. 36 PRJEB53466]